MQCPGEEEGELWAVVMKTNGPERLSGAVKTAKSPRTCRLRKRGAVGKQIIWLQYGVFRNTHEYAVQGKREAKKGGLAPTREQQVEKDEGLGKRRRKRVSQNYDFRRG